MERPEALWPNLRPDLWTGQNDPGLACPATEDGILELVDAFFPSRSPHVPFGRGHDCAELTAPAGAAANAPALALSTDMFWEDAHFRRAYFTPEEAGAKALTTAASDLAAAGAVPLGFSLGLLLPENISRAALSRVLQGMARKAHSYGLALSGGDLVRGDRLGFSVTVWGKSVENAPFLRRTRPEPGDVLFLIGQCGLARVGLWALEREGRAAMRAWPDACAALLEPEALIAQGQRLAQLAPLLAPLLAPQLAEEALPRPDASARISLPLSLMDVSDGLARDLPRLLGGPASELGADLNAELLSAELAPGPAPGLVPAEVARAAPLMGFSPIDLFFLGGEDYALLGSCPQHFWQQISAHIPEARLLGQVRRGKGITLGGKALDLRGFDHFSPAPVEIGPALPPASDVAAAIIRCCREAWKAGLMAGFNGNVSGRVYDQACLITRSGAAKARLCPADFALLSLSDGTHLHGPTPSTESAVHLGIYAACPDTAVIIHCHPPSMLALSLLLPAEKRLVLPLPEAESYRARIAWTPFFPPGSQELGTAVAKAATSHPAVWMERHGLVVHGPDLAFCLSLTEELEQLARVQLESSRGATPNPAGRGDLPQAPAIAPSII